MPGDAVTLSLVLVVHREQAYVGEFATSVLDQDFRDVEIVAVDDASPDHAPAVLDEIAARDTRLHVHHLPARVGLGAARDLGLAQARGEYVWFVHTPDLMPAGGLPVVGERLRRTAPDVLLVHHARADIVGRERPGPHARLLARLEQEGPAPLERRARAADLAPDAWRMIVRTALLRDAAIGFGGGRHGDLRMTWPALLAAERIDASAAVGYVRRERPNAVRDSAAPGSPFDVFADWDAVFAFADARGAIPAGRRDVAFAAMLRHELALLGDVPASARREFFHRMSDARRRHRRGTEPRPPGRVAPMRAELVARDAYVPFVGLDAAIDARRTVTRRAAAADRRRRRAVATARRKRRQRHYRQRLRAPTDPDLAVFAAYWYRAYSCNPRAIYEKARELVPAMRGVWVVERDAVDALPAEVEHVVAGTPEYYDVIARAAILVNNVNFPNHLVKRDGAVHVMTHHGTPLKRMGLDERLSPVTRVNFDALMRRCARWDYSISSNVFSTLIWERVYPLPYESLEVGYPRNDVLVRAGADDVARIRAELAIEPDQTAVLYAPTHRDHHTGFVPLLDLGAVADALGPDHVLLARAHYFYGADPLLRRLHGEGRVRDVAAHPSVEELCLAADVLVTDYSSIMFDYAVLDRPIVIHAPDWEVYRAIRGTYFDLLAEGPGVVTRTDGELVDALRGGAARSDTSNSARAAFRARFCTLDDGHAAERVVRRVWLGQRGPVPADVAPRAVGGG